MRYFLFSLVILMMATVAQATEHTTLVRLFGKNEVPPVQTDARGQFVIKYNDETNVLKWSGVWHKLSGVATSAHFHGPADRKSTAGIQVNLSIVNLPNGIRIGGREVLNDSQEKQLLNDLWYINVHSNKYPPGEIRGQVEFFINVPDPGPDPEPRPRKRRKPVRKLLKWIFHR